MTHDEHDTGLSRRDFLRRAGAAGLGAAAAGGLGWWLYDNRPPDLHPGRTRTIKGFDFATPGHKPMLAVVKGPARTKNLGAALAALGGLKRFIRPGDRVLLKVNAAFASPPLVSATTNPELLSAMIKLCRRAGADRVMVTDNPINDPASAFRLSGLEAAAQAGGAELLLPRTEFFEPITLAGAKLIRDWPVMTGPLARANRVIGLAPVKDHHRSGASMTMKNWYGLLGGARNVFHQDINGIIKELSLLVKPTLVVLDGTTTMVKNGPTGGSLDDLKRTDTMIVSTDQVAADALGANLLGKTVADLPWLGLAAAAGAGTVDVEALKPIRREL
jgi:uncharacterized protein (DUF362 family)